MMSGYGQIRFQADEDLKPAIVEGLRRRQSLLDVLTAKDAGLLGAADPDVLVYAAEHGRLLLSHDLSTMPMHVAALLANGRRSPGVLLIRQALPIAAAIEAVLLIWEASEPEEWQDRLTYLPLEPARHSP